MASEAYYRSASKTLFFRAAQAKDPVTAAQLQARAQEYLDLANSLDLTPMAESAKDE